MVNLSIYSESSITAKVESLISKMENMAEKELRNTFKSILEDSKTHDSPATRLKWLTALDKAKSKLVIMSQITNLYLAGCNLSTNLSKY